MTATLVDHLSGILGIVINRMVPVATKDLKMTYRKPLIVGHEYMVKILIKLKFNSLIFFFKEKIIGLIR
jgi:hypothetical protein